MSSVYTRMIRFFKSPQLGKLQKAINKYLVIKALELTPNQQVVYLSIDRTNWELGKQSINLLSIGVVLWNRKFIPLHSITLDKKGNSSQAERIDLLSKLLALNKELSNKRFCLVGDREFIGKDWFAALQKADIDFVMRTRTGDYKKQVQLAQDLCHWELDASIEKELQKRKAYVSPVKIDDRDYYYHVQKNKKKQDKDPQITWISSFANPFEVSNAFDKRWQIEVFFADIKTKNFNLEGMNFKQLDKVLMMFSLCAIVYLSILAKGMEVRLQQGQTPLIYDRKMNKFYPRKSLIKLGYDHFARDVGFFIQQLDKFMAQTFKPPKF